jgi:hypothetical protein
MFLYQSNENVFFQGRPNMRTVAKIACVTVFALFLGITVQAEIEKVAVACDTGVCLYWWPKLPAVPGWHQDKQQSLNYGANALAPNGSSFVDAGAVMYAVAVDKPREPEAKSLAMFIAGDKSQFLSSDTKIIITEVGGLVNAGGNKLASFTFFPKSNGNWEQVSYGEEGDFYLTFVLGARSKKAFDKAQTVYHDLIAHYKAKL